MPKLPRVTAAEARRAIERDGWMLVRQAGSHAHFLHLTKLGRVTIAVHAGVILPPKTLTRIIGDAQLTVDEFIDLL
ncbi:MAG: type II toxin-antitoxin system HicA family toxin [Chloroflexi bacterium]|nr:type II toxin-antitoxin system HicA family toxin [Chloroflexota bacterium]